MREREKERERERVMHSLLDGVDPGVEDTHPVRADGVEFHDVAQDTFRQHSVHVVFPACVHLAQQVHHVPDLH